MPQSNQLTVDISPGTIFPVVLGKSKTVDYLISNTSNDKKAYNVSIIINLWDSLELVSSTVQATSVAEQVNFSKNYNFINIKDFAPQEINFKMEMGVKSNETYKSGSAVAFQTKLQSTITITWDSMPRGSYDDGNIQYYNSVSYEFEVTRLSLKKTMPSKKVKGAGTDLILPSKPFDCVIEIENNTREESTFILNDSLPDTLRYIGDITIITPVDNPLPTAKVIYNTMSASKTITWDSCTLLPGEVLKFSYQSAIWNNYASNGVENTGSRIIQGTTCSTEVRASNTDFDIRNQVSIIAMDAILTASDNKTTVDVATVINYTLNIEVNQYYGIKNVVTVFLTPDGQEPISTTGGTVLPEDANHCIPVQYTIASINPNVSHIIALTTQVVAQYRADSEYVSCGDAFTANATLAAINIYDDTINDSSSCSQSIITPTILKKIVQIYYRNLDVKTSSTAVAPLDWIEYELSFDCSSITAAKRNILLDDFFPLETGMPVIEDVEQISGTPIVPVLIAPHGLRWNLGNVIDETPWVVRFKTQVGTSLTQSNLSNLFKLTGTTNAKTSYSDRKQTTILTGKPNLVITRYFDGFTPTNVYGGVEYSCRIKIANTQNETDSATDAFGFQFAEQTYNGITIVSDSWSASGTGLFTVPQGSSTFITAQILRLYVGQDITISYKVILPANIYPGFTGSLAAQAGIPYTQIIDSLLENVMYSMTSLSSSAQLKTRSLTFGKSYSDSDVKVGSIVHYTVQYMVPKGTAIYNAKLADDLPSGQALVGDVLLNGSTISVTVENQKITFPEVSVVNSTASDVTMVYTFTAVINSAAIVFPTTTQINTATLTYKNYLNSASTRTATRNVIIAHPLLTITLTPLNGTLLDSKTTFNMRVDMDNKSVIGARECQIQLPIPNDAVYVSSFSQLGSVSLNGSVLTWNIGNVSGLQKGSLSFSSKGNSNLLVTDSITYIATLLNYKNDLSDTLIYPQKVSNAITYACIPNVEVSVYPANRTLNGNGFFQFISNSIIEAPYTIINQGGGKDSFALSISPIKWPYDLFVSEVLITSVDASTAYYDTPSLLSQVPSGNSKDIRLKIYIPDLTQEANDRFTITAYSLADTNYFDSIETTLLDP